MRAQVLVVVMLAATCGCRDGRGTNSATESQMIPSQRTDEKAVRPYIQLNEQQIKALVEKVQNVQLGDSCQQVESLLGTPWRDELQYKKDSSHTFIGRSVVYYARMQDKELVNVRLDRSVEFWFDQNDRLTEIYAQNIEGIKNQP